MNIHLHHRKELKASAIARELAALNCLSYEPDDDAVYERFFRGADIDAITKRVRPDAQWGQVRKRWGHLGKGALAFVGLDPEEGWQTEMDWARFKPDSPRCDYQNPEKIVKYECRPGDPTRAMYFRVTLKVWQIIARENGLEMPEAIVTEKGEALGFWGWVAAHPSIPVIICEGEKKALCLLSHGRVAVSIPGIWNGARRLGESEFVFHPDLMRLVHPDRTFVILFDTEEKVKTQWNVFKATLRLGGCIERAGANVRIACLPGEEKGVDDWLAARPERGGEQLARILRDAMPLDEYRAGRVPGGRWGLHEWTPDIVSDEPFVSDIEGIPTEGLNFIWSRLGSGKTYYIEALLRQLSEENNKLRVLNVAHRIALLRNLSKRLGTTMYTGLGTTELMDCQRLSITVDSLPKLNHQLQTYDAIVLDEVSQVLRHLLASKTCRENRDNCLQIFQYFLKKAKLVTCLDAFITDFEIDFLTYLRGGDKKPFIVQGQQKGEGRDIVWYTGKRHCKITESIAGHIASGGKPAIFTTEKRYAKVLFKHLKKQFKDVSMKLICSETSGSEENQHFLIHINKLCLDIDVLICSPSVGSGVDISVDRFDRIFMVGFASHQTATDIAQQLWRVRANVPMEVWISPRRRGGYRSSSAEVLKQGFLKVGAFGDELLGRTAIRRNLDMETGEWKIENEDLLDFYCRMEAERNRSLNNLRASVKALLVDRLGCRIVREVGEKSPEVAQQLKDTAREMDEQYFFDVANAPEITPSEAEELEDKAYLEPKEFAKLENYRITRTYGKEVTEEVVKLDDRGRHIGKLVQLEALLQEGETSEGKLLAPAMVRERDARERANSGFLWDWKNHAAQWAVRQKLGLRELVTELGYGIEVTKEHPTITRLVEVATQHRLGVKQALGVSIGIKPQPIRIVSELLQQVGLKLVSNRKRRRGESGERKYSLDFNLWDFATEVLEYRKMRRDAREQRRKEEREQGAIREAGIRTQYGLDPVSSSPQNSRENGECRTRNCAFTTLVQNEPMSRESFNSSVEGGQRDFLGSSPGEGESEERVFHWGVLKELVSSELCQLPRDVLRAVTDKILAVVSEPWGSAEFPFVRVRPEDSERTFVLPRAWVL